MGVKDASLFIPFIQTFRKGNCCYLTGEKKRNLSFAKNYGQKTCVQYVSAEIKCYYKPLLSALLCVLKKKSSAGGTE